MVNRECRTTKQYDICQDGCYLFPAGHPEKKECEECKKPRYKNEAQVADEINSLGDHNNMSTMALSPYKQLTYTSVFESLVDLYADDDKLDILRYGENFLNNNSSADGDYKNIFSSSNYRQLIDRRIVSASTICLVLFVDGYQSKNSQKSHQVMSNCLIMNIHPQHRYYSCDKKS